MAFVLFSERHAIAEITFALQITPQITHHDRAMLLQAHSKWRKFLPDVVNVQSVGFSIGTPLGQPPPPPPPPPIQFVRGQTGGSLEWRLHAAEGNVVINCLAYTRWHDVWKRARTLFTNVSKILPNETAISSASLQYTNVFPWDKTTDEGYNVRKLLNENSPRVPAAILECGPYWHLHQGWFSQVDELPEIARALDRTHMGGTDDPKNGRQVKFESLHRLDFTADATPRFRKAFRSDSTTIDSHFDFLHKRAKASLSDYLAAGLRERLGLHATE